MIEDNNTVNKLHLAYQAARLYYECDENQEEIARKLGVSRPQISRLLKLAREQGLVEFKVKNPLKLHTRLEKNLCERFSLRQAIVVPLSAEKPDLIKEKLANVASSYVSDVLMDGMVIGIPWGSTLNHLTKVFPEKSLEDTVVVQLKGGVSKVSNKVDTFNPIITLAKKINGSPCFLPAPSIVNSIELKNVFLQEEKIKETLELGNKAEIAIYSIGLPNEYSVLIEAGYFTKSQMQELREQGAVGDICSRYFTIEGEIFNKDLDERTIGIDIKSLKNKEYSIGIAGGEERAPGILGALRGGFTNVLITDEKAAQKVLELDN
ncbi:sugar-binding transcriptional regulator [Natranaerobius trueperi]|nr:sugar-binding transcriptional regulator [Natranaerobius trueperi]